MNEKKLMEEFDYYLDHQDELVEQYNGKYIVIMNHEVVGAYESESEAIEKTLAKKKRLGTFLVQKCEPGEASYTQTFHSSVAFA